MCASEVPEVQVSSYAPSSDDVLALARADTAAQAKPLIVALQIRIEELTEKLLTSPRRSDELTEDCGGILCELRGLRWLLSLIHDAQDLVNRQ
jgi:hypothetical protein